MARFNTPSNNRRLYMATLRASKKRKMLALSQGGGAVEEAIAPANVINGGDNVINGLDNVISSLGLQIVALP